MPDEITLDDVLRKQRAMLELVAQLQDERNVDRIQALAERLRGEGAELERMAQAVAAKAGEGESRRGYTVVSLTAEQKQRIAAATGVTLDEIRIPDEAGIATRTMPHTDPRIVEYWATQQARQVAVAREADAQTRAQLDEVLGVLEAQGSPAIDERLAEIKADPKFLGGILKKK